MEQSGYFGVLEQHDYYNDTRRGKALPTRYTSKNTDKSGNHQALRQFDNIAFRQYNPDVDTTVQGWAHADICLLRFLRNRSLRLEGIE